MAGNVMKAVDHWVEWTFRTIFGLLIALIMWQGQRIYLILDRHDEQIEQVKIDFAAQSSKVDAQVAGMRDTLLDIKAKMIDMDSKLDRIPKQP